MMLQVFGVLLCLAVTVTFGFDGQPFNLEMAINMVGLFSNKTRL
jgi:hypothetical protein